MSLLDVQTCLLELETVEACAVLERKTSEGRLELVAYVVSPAEVSEEALREHLAGRLPAGSIPTVFVPISCLPLTELGDLDAAALEALNIADEGLARRWEQHLASLPGAGQVAVAVETVTEEPPRLHLAEVLGLDDRPPEQQHVAAVPDIQSKAEVAEVRKKAFVDGGPLAAAEGAPETLTEALLRTVAEHGENGVTYVEDHGAEVFQSYAALLEEARQRLAGLQAAGLDPGDRAILQIASLHDYCVTFWACVLGGITPATVAVSPSYDEGNAIVAKLRSAWLVLDRPAIIASPELVQSIAALGLEGLRLLTSSHVEADAAEPSIHAAKPEDILFIQLSSGSTGTSKCIQESHRCVASHVQSCRQFNAYSADDVVLNWLPMDHVGALLMLYLRGVCVGCNQVLVKPDVVLTEPLRWLDLLEAHRATHTWAPNFGYKLLADRLAAATDRHWDLSTMKFFMNGGEQVTLPVCRDFLLRVAPFGVPERAMQPAFGMAETCTGMTYQNQFDLEATPYTVLKASLGMVLQPAGENDPSETVTFLDSGRVIPGMAMRIVDQGGRVADEGVIGRLQLKGQMITPGYLNNQEANAEAFGEDGWFNPGDLGFILDGKLTLTGREKETIVVRGANLYCHEIEDLAGSVGGVEPTYVGACAVEDSGTGTEGFAIFFSPRPDVSSIPGLVKAIKGAVASKLGVAPTYVVPVPKEEFPKTTSGKIQRLQLKDWLNSGHFDAELRKLDMELGGGNTLLNWFYRPVWRRKQIFNRAASLDGSTILFGNGSELQDRLSCVVVEAGQRFERTEQRRYRIDPASAEDYKRLFASVREDAGPVGQIVCLESGAVTGPQAAMDAAIRAMLLIQGLDPAPVRLVAISQGGPDCGPLLGVLRSARQELPWLDCRHVEAPDAATRQVILNELAAIDLDREVAYKGGERYVRRLERIDFRSARERRSPLRRGGLYLLSGGLGGVGIEVAGDLLRRYEAKLVIIGRTPSQMAEAQLRQLSQLPGDVVYEQADVCDPDRVRAVMAEAESRWHRGLSGVIHLAGVYHERLLLEESPAGLAETLRPKVLGAWTLHRALADRPECPLITFSSAAGFYGLFNASAYAAANAYLDSLALYRHQQGLPTACLAWTAWEGTGLSADGRYDEVLRSRGYHVLPPEQALQSLTIGLQAGEPYLIAGLNESRARVQQDLEQPVRVRRGLHAYLTSETAIDGPSAAIMDRFGVASQCQVTRVGMTPGLRIDRNQLIALGRQRSATDELDSDIERELARIWRELLGVSRVGRHDNFFELGGNSLLSMRAIGRMRQELGLEVDLPTFFERPTIAALASNASATSRQDLVPPVSRAPRDGLLPLSFAQQRLWFIDRFGSCKYLYNEPAAAVRIEGDLDREALAKSLTKIVRRHESLRTAFEAVDGEPRQAIVEPMPVALPEIDLRHLPPDELEEAATRLAIEEVQRPFDLTRPPLLRALLLCLADNKSILVLTLHHIAFDGWSLGVLRRELGELYGAYATSGPPPFPELDVQYADYAAWQRSWLQGDVLNRQLAYWRGKLADLPSLELPADRPRPALESHRGEVCMFQLPGSLRKALESLGQAQGASLFMTLLAAFYTLLLRLTGQEDLVLGSPIAGRRRPELEGLIGFFVNTLILRVDASANPSFRELLGRVHKTALEAFAHQDVPFDRVVDEVQPERELSHSPLTRMLFALQNAPMGTPELPGLRVSPLDLDFAAAKFDLIVHLFEAENGLQGRIEFNTDLFDKATVARLAGHYQTVLEAVAADPDKRLGEVPLLTAEEQRQLLVDWNATERPYPRDAVIPELLEAQAARTPEAPAVRFGEQELSYRELDRRANQLAHRLRGLGVGPDVVVAVYLERSVEMVVTFLAILKSGGAYLPLDLSYPAERLAFMLQDAAAPLVITREPLLDRLPETAPDTICLDSDWPSIAEQPEDPLGCPASATDLAYVIYTSGSTGLPKGVAVPHLAVVRLVSSTDYAQLRPDDRVAQASNASFDAATFEIWGALLNGAQLIGVTKETLLSPRAIAGQLRDDGITTLFVTTALFNQLAANAPGAFSGLRHLLFGGEAVDPRAVRRVLQEQPPERLLHVYGPTETTTFATWQLVEGVAPDATTVPIGRPIANTTAYVLDTYHQPVPVGVPGELYLGGDGLARGYLNRPDMTAERFIPSPFAEGERLYATGDLVRYRPDGAIEFLGRRDSQIKIRGFRVELGEIEVLLRQHPAIGDAIVVAREDRPGDKRLIAYVVAEAAGSVSEAELRQFLEKRLPGYMIPSRFVELERLPLTANGKIDRRALPVPEDERPAMPGYAAPQTELEHAIAGIWREVLHVDRVGLHDNFFDLGGNSLLLVQVQARLEAHLGREVNLVDLLQHATVGTLAARLALDGRPSEPARDGRGRGERYRQAMGRRQIMEESGAR